MRHIFTIVIISYLNSPPNIRYDEDVLKMSFVFVFNRRLDQEHICPSHTSSEDVLVRTNIFVLAIRLQDFFKTFSRSFQDVFKTSCKTSSRHLQDIFKTFWRRLQDIFKTFWRRLQDIFKTYSRHLQDALARYLPDVFKTYQHVKLFLITSLQDVFKHF